MTPHRLIEMHLTDIEQTLDQMARRVKRSLSPLAASGSTVGTTIVLNYLDFNSQN